MNIDQGFALYCVCYISFFCFKLICYWWILEIAFVVESLKYLVNKDNSELMRLPTADSLSHPRVVWCLYCVNNISIESVSLFPDRKTFMFCLSAHTREEPWPFLVISTNFFLLSFILNLNNFLLQWSWVWETELFKLNHSVPFDVFEFQSMTH